LHLDAVAWARDAAGAREPDRVRVVVALGAASAAVAEVLRARGISAVVHAPETAKAFAQAWRFSHLVCAQAALSPGGDATRRVIVALSRSLETEISSAAQDPTAIAAAIANAIS
jgi:hypothetical protein